MTTIAWDGATLAGDRRVSQGGASVAQTIKVRRTPDGRLVGACGSISIIHAILDAFDRHERPAEWDDAEALEVLPDGSVFCHDKHGRAPLLGGRHAIGSGMVPALVAMACGKDAAEAVRLAGDFDTGTGGGVDALALHPAPKRAARTRR